MVDVQYNIFVVAGYCQEEILSACFMCVNLPLHMWRCAESVGCQSLTTYCFYWLRTRCLIRLSSGIRIPIIAHLNSDELERMLCWKSDVNTSPSAQVWLHMWPVDSVPFHLRQIFPGRPCLGGQGYSCPVYLLKRYHVATRYCQDQMFG